MDIRAHVQALNENRIKAHKALNDHFDECTKAHPGQPMSAEERVVEDRINEEIEGLESEIRRFVANESREQESAKVREAHASLFSADDKRAAEAKDRTFVDWLRGKVSGDKDNGVSIDLAPAARLADMVRAGADTRDIRNATAGIWTTSQSSGSLLIPTELANEIYGYLTASVAMLALPTTKIHTSMGNPLEFPKVGTHGIGTQVGEGTAIGGTDPVFAKMRLDSYKYGQLVKVSTEMIQDDTVDILGFVAKNVTRAIGEVLATALVTGGGSGAPNGIETVVTNANAPTGGTIHGTAGAVSYENLVDLVYSVNGNYRASGDAAFLMRDLTVRDLRKLRDGSGGTVGNTLWDASTVNGIQGAEPDTLLGYPVFTDPNVASIASAKKVAFFGDWGAYYVRTAEGFRFERSDQYAFNTDEVSFRGLLRADGDSIDANAINALRLVF